MSYVLLLVESLAVAWFARELGVGWWIWCVLGVLLVAELSFLGTVRLYLQRQATVSLNCPLGQSEPARAPQAKA